MYLSRVAPGTAKAVLGDTGAAAGLLPCAAADDVAADEVAGDGCVAATCGEAAALEAFVALVAVAVGKADSAIFTADAAATGAIAPGEIAPGESAVPVSSVDATGSSSALPGPVAKPGDALTTGPMVVISVLTVPTRDGEGFLGRGAGAGVVLAVALAGVVEGAMALAAAGGWIGANAMLRVEKGCASTRAVRWVACKECVVPTINHRCAATTPTVSRLSVLEGIAADCTRTGAEFIGENFASFAS